ncbi:acyl carrier protein phosphodiesterase [Silvimonas amylolytica]|uniref:ACP phosphodiesterase n=1 Tax=Silvimonas amylolytica TaxID=449663 RepID=A0ABQ2PLY7_9NEIS|nr:ACP phosphodiesterase [Silvimonas amylolytica]GGP26623.1 ACP phosphodiesterase [Silvimonas amylolytica]
MNYLAHILLAGPDPAYRLGALLGDFVKGPMPGVLPPAVAEGVILHRSIDVFTDAHPAFLASRARVSGARRRYSGIMVDMFYDHFLAAHWAKFGRGALPDFAGETYALFAQNGDLLPARLAQILPNMTRNDWLTSYRRPEAIAGAINGMAAHRLSQPNALGGGGDELLEKYAEFEGDFLAFWPQVRAHAEAFRQQHGMKSAG